MTKIYIAPTPTDVTFGTAAQAVIRQNPRTADISQGFLVVMGGDREFSGRIVRFNGGKPNTVGSIADLARGTRLPVQDRGLVLCADIHEGRITGHLQRQGYEIGILRY